MSRSARRCTTFGGTGRRRRFSWTTRRRRDWGWLSKVDWFVPVVVGGGVGGPGSTFEMAKLEDMLKRRALDIL
jgi:hypothetical protein